MFKTSLIPILFSLLLACGSGPAVPPPPADELLIPEITADGSKFFVFQRNYHRPQPSEFEFERRASERRRADMPRVEEDVEGRLLLIMERTGYCRNGFFELYREQTTQSFAVRGECREGASDEDRQRFDGTSIVLN